jgi:nucleotide-binding universal stress UspA family protein
MYKNILLPTDGLGKCVYGTCHGVVLAKELNAKVTAVCVTDKLSAYEILEIYHPYAISGRAEVRKVQEDMVAAEGSRKELAQKALEVAERMCTEAGVPCETVHLAGKSPTDGFLKVAKEKGCDLIFISTHGNPGVMGTLFGTIATKLLSHSKIPVLVHYCGGPG